MVEIVVPSLSRGETQAPFQGLNSDLIQALPVPGSPLSERMVDVLWYAPQRVLYLPASHACSIGIFRLQLKNSQIYGANTPSISASSASPRLPASRHFTFSSTCSGRLAPISAVVTAGWRRTQARAI